MKPFILLFSLLTGMIVHSQNASLTVIANPNGAPHEMNMAELKSIFKGEKQKWSNGNKIMIALMKSNTDAGKLTSNKVYGMSGDEVTKFWLALTFSGKAAAPAFFNTVGELQTFVTANPGAIGIIDQSPPAGGVQVLLVDGKRSF